MAGISQISNGAGMRALYNQIVTALAALGITTSDQLSALVTRLEIAAAAVYVDKDASGNMTFTDGVTGTKMLSELMGATPREIYLGGGQSDFAETVTANRLYLQPFTPELDINVTGIRFARTGGSSNVKIAMYDNDGVRIALNATNTAIGTDLADVTVSFNAAAELLAGRRYWAGVITSTTGLPGYAMYPKIHRYVSPGAYEVPATITIPASKSSGPGMTLVVSGGYGF